MDDASDKSDVDSIIHVVADLQVKDENGNRCSRIKVAQSVTFYDRKCIFKGSQCTVGSVISLCLCSLFSN